jgi:predicted Rossmann fold flavoprotein
MLLRECREAGVEIVTGCEVRGVRRGTDFEIESSGGAYHASAFVVATGGLSIPKLGATGIGYDIAKQFGLSIIEPRPGLVPFTVTQDPKISDWSSLSGIALRAKVTCGETAFTDDLLLTHRGLSGPAILQLSSYWDGTTPVTIDLLPDVSLEDVMEDQSGKTLKNAFDGLWPKRFSDAWLSPDVAEKYVRTLSKRAARQLEDEIHGWTIQPSGTEGFSKAEVTAGGVNTDALSSKTMEARDVRGLFFVGEVVDVTGWLGGYNFQWAWSSGYAAGESL